MEKKLYVGNLPYSTTGDSLRTLFAQAGSVTDVAVIKDRLTGQSKGFAFVQMNSSEEAENAIKMFNGYSLDNRALKVNEAKPKEEGSGRGFGGGGFRNDRGFDRGNSGFGQGRGYGNNQPGGPGRGFGRGNDRGRGNGDRGGFDR